MAYSQFTISQIKADFGIVLREQSGYFSHYPRHPASDFLRQTLDYNIPLALAIDSEKSRSELIVAPILVEIKKQLGDRISLFSGRDFTVDVERGLSGFCDFLISRSSEQLTIEAPVIALVEAKNDNLQSGLGQCMAEMIAAQIFNRQHNRSIPVIYGVITTGSLWKFLSLQDQTVTLDLNEYFLGDLDQILGILIAMIQQSDPVTVQSH